MKIHWALPFILLTTLICSPAVAAHYDFVTFDFPPLEYENKDNRAEGVAVDIVRRVMNDLGHEVTIRVLPWPRALEMVRTGRADAIFTAYKNPAREKFLDYSREILIPQAVFFYTRDGSDAYFDGNVESIQGAIVGIVSTISYGQVFDAYKPFLRLDKANKLEHSFLKLMRGRIDLVPCNQYVAEYTMKKMGLSDSVIRQQQALEYIPSYIAFSKQRNLPVLRDKFDRRLKAMKAIGEYPELFNTDILNTLKQK